MLRRTVVVSALLGGLVLAGCGPADPDEPTWTLEHAFEATVHGSFVGYARALVAAPDGGGEVRDEITGETTAFELDDGELAELARLIEQADLPALPEEPDLSGVEDGTAVVFTYGEDTGAVTDVDLPDHARPLFDWVWERAIDSTP